MSHPTKPSIIDDLLRTGRRVFTRKEAAAYLSRLIGPVSDRTIEAYDIPHRAPMGHRVIYRKADLDEWAAKRLGEAPRRAARSRTRPAPARG